MPRSACGAAPPQRSRFRCCVRCRTCLGKSKIWSDRCAISPCSGRSFVFGSGPIRRSAWTGSRVSGAPATQSCSRPDGDQRSMAPVAKKQLKLKEKSEHRKRLDEIRELALRQGYGTEVQVVWQIRLLLKKLKEGQLKIEDFIKVDENAATEQALKKECQRAVKIMERVFVLQRRYNELMERQGSRMAERQRTSFQANFAKVEAELTQELHKLSMNPRMVEGLAAPLKEMAQNALELDELVAVLERKFGHSVEEINEFARRLKKGPKELRAVKRDSGLEPAQIAEFLNELKMIKKGIKELEDEAKMSRDHLLELHRQIADGERSTEQAKRE